MLREHSPFRPLLLLLRELCFYRSPPLLLRKHCFHRFPPMLYMSAGLTVKIIGRQWYW